MFRGGHEPGTRIIWDARLGPAFERGEERVLGELFREADIANDASEPGNNFGGLDSPDGIDRAMSIGVRHDL
jgi:hypothetical protein